MRSIKKVYHKKNKKYFSLDAKYFLKLTEAKIAAINSINGRKYEKFWTLTLLF
jgi:hypothetical protein